MPVSAVSAGETSGEVAAAANLADDLDGVVAKRAMDGVVAGFVETSAGRRGTAGISF